VVVVVVVVVAAAAAVVVYKNTFVSHMTTGFEQKYEHDILIKKKKMIKWTGYLNVLFTVYR
jgi:hypothetical protein